MTSDFDAPEVLSVATAFLIGSLVRYFHAFWGQYIGIPFSLVIIVIGCALKSSSVYLEYGDLLTASFDLRGDHVMLIVFPLILFYAAYRIPLHSLRILWKQILLTAVLGKSKRAVKSIQLTRDGNRRRGNSMYRTCLLKMYELVGMLALRQIIQITSASQHFRTRVYDTLISLNCPLYFPPSTLRKTRLYVASSSVFLQCGTSLN